MENGKGNVNHTERALKLDLQHSTEHKEKDA